MIVLTTMEKLPNYCHDCPCNNGEYGRCEADTEKRTTLRPYWCPLKLELLKEQPEIVRCKDCRHGVCLDDSDYYVCSRPFASNRETHTADWFCADGERK